MVRALLWKLFVLLVPTYNNRGLGYSFGVLSRECQMYHEATDS